MTTRMQQLLAGAVVALFVLVIVLVLVIQWGEDGAVLFANDSGTLSILGMTMVMIALVISGTMQSGNLSAGYERLIRELTSNRQLGDALESKYMATPEGLPRLLIDFFADAAGYLVMMTPTEKDDVLKSWLDQLRDGKPNDRASPANDLGMVG